MNIIKQAPVSTSVGDISLNIDIKIKEQIPIEKNTHMKLNIQKPELIIVTISLSKLWVLNGIEALFSFEGS